MKSTLPVEEFKVRTLLVLGIGIGMLAAQDTPSASVQVTLAQAVREAIDKNLGLLAERYNVSIAEARMITAQAAPQSRPDGG